MMTTLKTIDDDNKYDGVKSDIRIYVFGSTMRTMEDVISYLPDLQFGLSLYFFDIQTSTTAAFSTARDMASSVEPPVWFVHNNHSVASCKQCAFRYIILILQ